ncbi:MAG TPA: hypothetical protein VGO52_17575 [Hyphomonadaceae bacterium]|jgi:hypothetical protein|nr:hypothetical protein [Hyphomonadaceae bacterium]
MSAPAFTQAAAAIAIILSVIVRWIRSGASWQAIDEGRATADILRDITGILDFEKLQDAFGPPRLEDGVFPVTHFEVKAQRTSLGYLMGDKWLDGGSMVIALVAILPVWPVWGTRVWLDVMLVFAGLYQVAGWLAATRLIGRR